MYKKLQDCCFGASMGAILQFWGVGSLSYSFWLIQIYNIRDLWSSVKIKESRWACNISSLSGGEKNKYKRTTILQENNTTGQSDNRAQMCVKNQWALAGGVLPRKGNQLPGSCYTLPGWVFIFLCLFASLLCFCLCILVWCLDLKKTKRAASSCQVRLLCLFAFSGWVFTSLLCLFTS